MCHLNAEAYPDSLALATDTTVTIGKNIGSDLITTFWTPLKLHDPI